MKILLVEDDPGLGVGLVEALNLAGYLVEWKKSVQEATLVFAPGKFDLVLLDIGLPDGSGTDLCRSIRDLDKKLPVIFLTARTDEDTVVRSLELGANDFVKKPFSQKELLARIKAHLRTVRTPLTETTIEGLRINEETREVFYDGKPLELNRRQFDVLIYFVLRPDQIITRDQLLSYLGQDGAIYDRTIDAHISQLRKVLKSNGIDRMQISPVYGVGYRFEIVV